MYLLTATRSDHFISQSVCVCDHNTKKHTLEPSLPTVFELLPQSFRKFVLDIIVVPIVLPLLPYFLIAVPFLLPVGRCELLKLIVFFYCSAEREGKERE